MSNGFGDAPIKIEGMGIKYDENAPDVVYEHTWETTTYVERRVPIELEYEAHTLIDNWLKAKGFDPEEI